MTAGSENIHPQAKRLHFTAEWSKQAPFGTRTSYYRYVFCHIQEFKHFLYKKQLSEMIFAANKNANSIVTGVAFGQPKFLNYEAMNADSSYR
jgi:hypothetical protein